MFLTITNFAKKGKTLLVQVKSLASRHSMTILRDKTDDKIGNIKILNKKIHQFNIFFLRICSL